MGERVRARILGGVTFRDADLSAPYADRVADYLRIGEVAQAVGVSVDTLRRWEAEGRITFERRGNQRVLPASELAGLLHARSPAATGPRAPATGFTGSWSRSSATA